MSIISISATKAQKDGAKYLFGSKGEGILAVLESLAKAKELRTPHLSGLINMLKDAEDEELIKFKSSPAGIRTIENAKQLATAKTLVTSIKALRGVKVNSKWIVDHQDVKVDLAAETVTHRATGRGGKPQKGNELVNHQAPEAETIESTPKDGKFSQRFKVSTVRSPGLSSFIDSSAERLATSITKDYNDDWVEYSVRNKAQLDKLIAYAHIKIDAKGIATSTLKTAPLKKL